jgi:hypothetical protein
VRRRLRLLLLLWVLVLIDVAVFQALVSTTSADGPLSRLLSLGSSFVLLLVLERRPAGPHEHQYPAGFLPLVIATFALCYGTFVALLAQTPDVQPLVHVILSSFGGFVFGVLGWWRIRRWQN